MDPKRLIQRIFAADFRRDLRRYLEAQPALHAVPYWLSATLAALIAVVYTGAFHALSDFIMGLLKRHPVVVFAGAPLFFCVSQWFVRRLAPGAAGSGVPQVMAAIDMDQETHGKILPRLLSLRVVLVKMLSSISCLLGGGALGPEGPTIQITASLFHSIGSRFRVIWPQIGHQSLIIAGGAAGIAAAFNTPLGGIVFALEELSHQYFNRFKTVLISAVIISGMVSQWFLGPYLYFGYPSLGTVTSGSVPWAIGVGIICGTLGASFGKVLLKGIEIMQSHTTHERVLFAAASGVLTVSSAYLIDPHVMGGGVEVIQDLLFKEGATASWGLVLGRFLAPMLAYLSGCAGGLLAPGLAAGAVLGSKIGELAGAPNQNLMVLLGMASFLSGTTRAPFTAFVLVLEMTDRHSAIFPMMVASVTAYAISHLVDKRSFYEYRRDYYATLGSVRVDSRGRVVDAGETAHRIEEPKREPS